MQSISHWEFNMARRDMPSDHFAVLHTFIHCTRIKVKGTLFSLGVAYPTNFDLYGSAQGSISIIGIFEENSRIYLAIWTLQSIVFKDKTCCP
jgi:hypothetical protein